jgi:hypothetical protein
MIKKKLGNKGIPRFFRDPFVLDVFWGNVATKIGTFRLSKV